MPKLSFTANIQRHVACPTVELPGTSVRTVLEAAFKDNPAARSYILDDQGALRRHMNIFVDGIMIRDRTGLSDAVQPHSSIHVFQALSGG